MVERFLMDDYKPHQLSTYALSLYKTKQTIKTDEGEKSISVGNENISMYFSFTNEVSCNLIFES